VISTPNQSGAVLHVVLSGQTLWQIAIAYNVKILDIKALNNLPDDNIYPGDTLLIKNESPAVSIPTATPAFAPTDTPTPTITFTALPNTTVPTSTVAESTVVPAETSSAMSVVMGLVALTILVGGYIAWRGNSQADSK
jgi:LysM repeat protein